MIDRFKFFAVALQNRISIYILSFVFKKRFSNLELVRYGTHYGGWWIPRAFLSRNFSITLVSAGLGHDTSFDLLMAKSGAKIIGIDPLPECVDLAKLSLEEFDFTGVNAALSASSGEARIYPPKNNLHDSWSLTNVHGTSWDDSIVVPTISLDDVIAMLGSREPKFINILKMDVEGAEEILLPLVSSSEFKFHILLAELDLLSLIPFKDIRSRIRKLLLAFKILRLLRQSGYVLLKVDGFNFLWINRQIFFESVAV
jgi:FkbM family methyltransferase